MTNGVASVWPAWLRVPLARLNSRGPRTTRREHIPAELLELAALDAPQALERLNTTERGLTPEALEQRREQWGPNRVAQEQAQSLVTQLLGRLLNPLNV